MKSILVIVAIVAAVLLVVAVSAAVMVLIASGLGALLARFLPFPAFEATLLSLIATIGVVVLVGQIVATILRVPPIPGTHFSVSPVSDDEDEEDDDWEDDEDEWEDDEEDILDAPDVIPSIPRWRQPIKRTMFDNVGRNDPCPCGSGKKYKNCHGKPGAAN